MARQCLLGDPTILSAVAKVQRSVFDVIPGCFLRGLLLLIGQGATGRVVLVYQPLSRAVFCQHPKSEKLTMASFTFVTGM